MSTTILDLSLIYVLRVWQVRLECAVAPLEPADSLDLGVGEVKPFRTRHCEVLVLVRGAARARDQPHALVQDLSQRHLSGCHTVRGGSGFDRVTRKERWP